MSNEKLLEYAGKIEKEVSDYRKEESLNPKQENILKWVSQFSEVNQEVILKEMLHIFSSRYLTEIEVDSFLTKLVTNKKLTLNKGLEYWNEISLLDIQDNGNSQKMMNEKFINIVKKLTKVELPINDYKKKHFIHLDDFLFTGNRLRHDLNNWFKVAPKNIKLEIIYIGYYKSGQYYVSNNWLKKNNPNNIDYTFWRLAELENNSRCQNVSHVLWPTETITEEKGVNKYIEEQGECFFRDESQTPGYYCCESIFSSEENRKILEKEFTIAGLKINNDSITDEKKKKYWKPLGISSFKGLGFGAMLFNYRNCPNNAPLAFWWGDWDEKSVWYPLFKRKGYEMKVPAIEEFEKIEW